MTIGKGLGVIETKLLKGATSPQRISSCWTRYTKTLCVIVYGT